MLAVVTDDETYVLGSDAAGLSELEYWKAVSGSGRVEELAAFVAAYPSSLFADLARLRILRAQHAAATPDIVAPAGGEHAASTNSRWIRVDASGATMDEHPVATTTESLPIGSGLSIAVVRLAGGALMMGATTDEALAARRELSHAAAATALRWIQEEQPRRSVTVSPFAIGRTPVTQREWTSVARLPRRSRDLAPNPSEFAGDDRPVERVSWYDATEFCDRLSVATGRNVRLPTEAEWEFACRGGTESPFAFGSTLTPELANYHCSDKFAGGPTGEPLGRTSTVGRYGLVNPFGLVDMHGNVWEWCRDWHARDSYTTSAVVDPRGPCSGTSRVRRGGSWRTPPVFCRSAARFSAPPGFQHADTGFRITVLD